jgi:hypothetical protein
MSVRPRSFHQLGLGEDLPMFGGESRQHVESSRSNANLFVPTLKASALGIHFEIVKQQDRHCPPVPTFYIDTGGLADRS